MGFPLRNVSSKSTKDTPFVRAGLSTFGQERGNQAAIAPGWEEYTQQWNGWWWEESLYTVVHTFPPTPCIWAGLSTIRLMIHNYQHRAVCAPLCLNLS